MMHKVTIREQDLYICLTKRSNMHTIQKEFLYDASHVFFSCFSLIKYFYKETHFLRRQEGFGVSIKKRIITHLFIL